jgi:predicted DNA-binding mobile mystery protein A
MKRIELARKHLERRLATLRTMELSSPPRGWLRAVREALGMTAEQLAARRKVATSRIYALEKAEATGATTLKSLREAAEAMGCTLVYAIVPTKPIDDLMRARASELADQELSRVHHTMRLENQALEGSDLAAARERMINAYLDGNPRRLWEKL